MNDSIAIGAEKSTGAESFEFFCECGDLTCKEVVRLTVAQYRGIRTEPVIAHARSTQAA